MHCGTDGVTANNLRLRPTSKVREIPPVPANWWQRETHSFQICAPDSLPPRRRRDDMPSYQRHFNPQLAILLTSTVEVDIHLIQYTVNGRWCLLYVVDTDACCVWIQYSHKTIYVVDFYVCLTITLRSVLRLASSLIRLITYRIDCASTIDESISIEIWYLSIPHLGWYGPGVQS